MKHPKGLGDTKSKRQSRPDALYERAFSAKRTGPLFGAFPYPTKISPEAIALYIASHTKPGDTVFDGFAGSGTTGLAAMLCENPSDELRAEADRLGLEVEWGARNAVLYELGTLGALVGRTLTDPPDPKAFRTAAECVLHDIEEDASWMYGGIDPEGGQGVIRHAVWSDLLRCPACCHETTLWEVCVSLNPARIESAFECPRCLHRANLKDIERSIEEVSDEIAGCATKRRARELARVYGVTGSARWSRLPTKSDEELLARIAEEPVPECVPRVSIPWGDLFRRGYHLGITHLHHFYTRRNLIAFARLWESAGNCKGNLNDALRFWLLSYNASHATMMTRVVAKSNEKDLVVTSAQPGVLYVSGLPVEKNLFAGLRRKLATITRAFETVRGASGKVEVIQGSSCEVRLPSGSIDYVFTDPPFGANIPYAELNFINEAWLKRFTNRADEAIISPSQRKSINEYRALLTRSFSESRRVLKPSGKATIVFHSASAEIWNALQCAYRDAGFDIERAGVLDKKQGSFKQVTAEGAVRGDPVLLLSPGRAVENEIEQEDCVWAVAAALYRNAHAAQDPAETTPQRLYSRLVAHFLGRRKQVPLDADAFYRWHAEQSQQGGLSSVGG